MQSLTSQLLQGTKGLRMSAECQFITPSRITGGQISGYADVCHMRRRLLVISVTGSFYHQGNQPSSYLAHLNNDCQENFGKVQVCSKRKEKVKHAGGLRSINGVRFVLMCPNLDPHCRLMQRQQAGIQKHLRLIQKSHGTRPPASERSCKLGRICNLGTQKYCHVKLSYIITRVKKHMLGHNHMEHLVWWVLEVMPKHNSASLGEANKLWLGQVSIVPITYCLRVDMVPRLEGCPWYHQEKLFTLGRGTRMGRGAGVFLIKKTQHPKNK